MKITYIGHSGFFVELADVCFLFDYYEGEIPSMSQEKELLVFVSHKHPDHYNSKIFGLMEQYPHVRYILSKEVPVKWFITQEAEKGKEVEPYLCKVRRKQCYDIILHSKKTLQVQTLKSTDIGVAYLLRYEGLTIYHAGDLNLWLWAGESKQANENMKKAFFDSMEDLRGEKIHVAFVPLDPRQEGDAYGGMEAFLELTETKKVFPMHCFGQYHIIREFISAHPEYEDVVQIMEREGQEFIL